MRKAFDLQLDSLNNNLMQLANLTSEAVEKSVQALMEKDSDIANDVIAGEREVDRLSAEVQQQCIRIVLLEQPVASDLRFVSAAMDMNTDLERIGDQAEDIAKLVKDMLEVGYRRRELGSVKKMSSEVSEMTKEAVKAFANGDSDLATKVIARDDVVDALFVDVRNEVIEEIRSESGMEPATTIDVMMIAKYLERIGDHAENIGEAVLYSLTGSSKPQQN